MDERLIILVGADVPPDPNAGASGTVYQMNAALRRLGHRVDEIWGPDMGRGIRHGNLHYLMELPWKYKRAVRQKARAVDYDVIELNQPHAYLAARDHQRQPRRGVFVNRSHGHEERVEEVLSPWHKMLGEGRKPLLRRAVSDIVRRLLARQWTRIARDADGFHVSCREDADFLMARYGVAEERIGVITQGVPDEYVTTTPRPFDAQRANRLLYVGQLAFYKAPMMLARAVTLLLEQCPQASMTWVCSEAHHRGVLELLPAELHGRVRLLAWMPQSELIRVLDEHGVFLFPSFFEGFGKAPLEAMARGLCVIASETGGMRDYIQSGENGLLVPVGRPDLMAERTLELMSDPARCRKMSAAARQTACQHTWDRCARDATDFYQRLLARKK
ncbi:MAG: glycosyltransferase family 4 protein [Thermoguttaceae bacterium]